MKTVPLDEVCIITMGQSPVTAAIARLEAALERASIDDGALFKALQSRAFRGEL